MINVDVIPREKEDAGNKHRWDRVWIRKLGGNEHWEQGISLDVVESLSVEMRTGRCDLKSLGI